MANIITASVTDKVALLVLDDATGLVIGEHVHVYNTGNTHIDGHHNLSSVDLDTGTVTYPVSGPDVPAYAPTGAILVAQVTWVGAADVELFVGAVTPGSDEADFLDICTDAANDWAYHRRHTAGYVDNPTVVPNSSVRYGTILLAVGMFREKGSIDSFQSFEAMPTPGTTGTMGSIMRYLQINRARIG